ncbi:MAG: diadenylate cyclase CdaA [Clostridiales bacterium]|nr:diadenylate cyclase CdaA [Clostridiales bacterium]MDY3747272.1 diadenylate cyclase CdaA [Lachnospiraceae bacterium]
MNHIWQMIKDFLSLGGYAALKPTSILEIFIIAFLIYNILVWIKNTRAWTLFRGIIVVIAFAVVAYLLELNTILWIFNKTFNVLVICVFIVFQPELRRALEQLGRKNFMSTLFGTNVSDAKEKKNNDRSINEVIKAAYEMAKVKTGALIVLEREVLLNEYERTGILLDSVVSSQLLVNIFEHNTPLHDGAVFIRNNRIVAATCYLPLSDNMELSKELGTRHRAAVGISEVSDSLTIVVSEETGAVSLARDGKLIRNLSADALKQMIGRSVKNENGRKLNKLKGIIKNEKKAAE